MNAKKNIWKMVKNRYRFSTRTQMTFELGFPIYSIGKCWFSTSAAYQIRTQKVSPSLQGMIFSDTIPLSWFTSSVLIPWAKILKMTISDSAPALDGMQNTPLSSRSTKQTLNDEYCALQLNDPEEMIINFPWSKNFTDYLQTNKLFDI